MSRRSPDSRPLRAVVALMALFAVLAAAGAGFAPHTDDGCRTETHCLVCRSSQGQVAAGVVAPALLHAELAAEAPAGDAPSLVPQTQARPHASRGPPVHSPVAA